MKIIVILLSQPQWLKESVYFFSIYSLIQTLEGFPLLRLVFLKNSLLICKLLLNFSMISLIFLSFFFLKKMFQYEFL